MTAIDIPGLFRPPYRAYPIVDHIADKLAATFDQRTTAAGHPQGGSRVKDAVDLLLLARTQTVDAAPLRAAIASELARRRCRHPAAGRHVADSCLPTIRALVDPVLAGSCRTGTWDPTAAGWTSSVAVSFDWGRTCACGL
ncbi:MAG: hypothetical protein DLM59_18045 [Pseudonocardiales bacterium]|nr:MAG: hypothetical protein DLM59_18045 [Pseudonocardiales bacterium]